MARRWLSLTRASATALFLLATCVALVGCEGTELTARYRAERMAWQVMSLERGMSENPELATDEMLASVAARHRAIIDRFPPPETVDESTADELLDIARITARSRIALASLVMRQATAETAEASFAEAIELLESVRDGYAFDRDRAIEAGIQLAALREMTGDWSGSIDELGELLDRWGPAADEAGTEPDPRILRIPLQRARGYVVRGMEDQADRVFREVDETYEAWVRQWDGTPTGRAALGLLAESLRAQGRWEDAVDAYERFDEDYGDDANRPGTWLALADIHGSRLGDEEAARSYYERVSEEYGDTPEGASADISIALLDIDDGEHEAARDRLTSVIERFVDEESVAATAKRHRAASYELEGRWDAAIAEYSALSAEYPTTMFGLAAPLRVVDLYAGIGEAEASETALEEAAQSYARVIQDYGGTPAEMAARNYLIETRVRQGAWGDAAEMLTETAERFPETQAAASMLLQAADIYVEEMGRADRARGILEIIIERYPDQAAAGRAAEILATLEE